MKYTHLSEGDDQILIKIIIEKNWKYPGPKIDNAQQDAQSAVY